MRILAETTGGFWTEYVSLLHDWPHWAFEFTGEAITGVIGFFFGRFWLRRHDRDHHRGHTTNEIPPAPDQRIN